jgi:hypothetical protein
MAELKEKRERKRQFDIFRSSLPISKPTPEVAKEVGRIRIQSTSSMESVGSKENIQNKAQELDKTVYATPAKIDETVKSESSSDIDLAPFMTLKSEPPSQEGSQTKEETEDPSDQHQMVVEEQQVKPEDQELPRTEEKKEKTKTPRSQREHGIPDQIDTGRTSKIVRRLNFDNPDDSFTRVFTKPISSSSFYSESPRSRAGSEDTVGLLDRLKKKDDQISKKIEPVRPPSTDTLAPSRPITPEVLVFEKDDSEQQPASKSILKTASASSTPLKRNITIQTEDESLEPMEVSEYKTPQVQDLRWRKMRNDSNESLEEIMTGNSELFQTANESGLQEEQPKEQLKALDDLAGIKIDTPTKVMIRPSIRIETLVKPEIRKTPAQADLPKAPEQAAQNIIRQPTFNPAPLALPIRRMPIDSVADPTPILQPIRLPQQPPQARPQLQQQQQPQVHNPQYRQPLQAQQQMLRPAQVFQPVASRPQIMPSPILPRQPLPGNLVRASAFNQPLNQPIQDRPLLLPPVQAVQNRPRSIYQGPPQRLPSAGPPRFMRQQPVVMQPRPPPPPPQQAAAPYVTRAG